MLDLTKKAYNIIQINLHQTHLEYAPRMQSAFQKGPVLGRL